MVSGEPEVQIEVFGDSQVLEKEFCISPKIGQCDCIDMCIIIMGRVPAHLPRFGRAVICNRKSTA